MTRPPATTSYVTVGLGKEVCAIEVGIVREILDSGPITRLPDAPPFLSGVIDVRGSTVPVIDLRVKLGMASAPVTQDTRILVADLSLDRRDLIVGLQVERVFEVVEFEADGLESLPDIGDDWRSEYIKAIGRLRGHFVIIFDLPKLFSVREIDGIPGLP
jgi:purine-binding chemotaxis protein CheW